MIEAAEYDALEGFESESQSEFAERNPVRRPSPRPSFQRRPSATPSYVTQVQLEAALTRVDGKIKTVSDGVSTINSRLSAIAAAAKKESEERKKEMQAQKGDLGGKLQMLALLPLLVPPTLTQTSLTSLGVATIDGKGNPVLGTSPGAASAPLTASTLSALLPLLLVGGMGGSGGFGSSGGSGSDGGMDMGTMLILALALSGALTK
jgi:hypothetical protein